MKPARLAVLGIAIAAGGTAAFLASRSEPPPPVTVGLAPPAPTNTVDVLVAKKDINIGQTISPQDLEWAAWPASNANPAYMRRTNRPDAVEQLSGWMARANIPGGQPVGESNLINAKGSGYMAAMLPQGLRAVATEISAETAAGGFVLPNDRVDVILTRRDREAERQTGIESPVAEVLLSNVKVLAIDQHIEDKTGRALVGRTATLELNQRQVQLLAMGRLMGTMSLALRSLADSGLSKPVSASRPDDDLGDAKRLNIVRFGVTSTTLVPK
jgi:pilus assembly protein CpaB